VPSTGELVPLLQIAPSKTDTQRLLVISPELADVLAAIISRIRARDGARQQQRSVPNGGDQSPDRDTVAVRAHHPGELGTEAALSGSGEQQTTGGLDQVLVRGRAGRDR
jgi:hypothetical protein